MKHDAVYKRTEANAQEKANSPNWSKGKLCIHKVTFSSGCFYVPWHTRRVESSAYLS
jgi:hypothetical protein